MRTKSPQESPVELSCPSCKHYHEDVELGTRREEEAVPVCPQCGYQYLDRVSDPEAFEQFTIGLPDYPSHELTTEEVHRRLPTLSRIEDDALREATAELSASAPAYFWVVPAARKYHHPRCQGTHGLWAHTLMVGKAVEDLLWTYESRDGITDEEADYARSAAILHDQFKNGPHADPDESSTADHAVKMAEKVRRTAGIPDPVAGAISSHMGASDYDGPVPEFGGVDGLVHMADYWGSRADWTPALPGPLPDEIRDLGFEEAG